MDEALSKNFGHTDDDEDLTRHMHLEVDVDIGDRYADDDSGFGTFGGIGGGAPLEDRHVRHIGRRSSADDDELTKYKNSFANFSEKLIEQARQLYDYMAKAADAVENDTDDAGDQIDRLQKMAISWNQRLQHIKRQTQEMSRQIDTDKPGVIPFLHDTSNVFGEMDNLLENKRARTLDTARDAYTLDPPRRQVALERLEDYGHDLGDTLRKVIDTVERHVEIAERYKVRAEPIVARRDSNEDFFTFGATGGGAPKQSAAEKALADASERIRKREKKTLDEVRVAYMNMSGASMRYWHELRKGERTESQWLFRLQESEKWLRAKARQVAQMTTVDPKASERLLSEADRILERLNQIKSTRDEIFRSELLRAPPGLHVDDIRENAIKKGAIFDADLPDLNDQDADLRKTSRSASELITEYRDLVHAIDNGNLSFREARALLRTFPGDFRKAMSQVDRSSDDFRMLAVAEDDAGDKIREMTRLINENSEGLRRNDRHTNGLIRTLERANSAFARNGENIATLDNKLRGLMVLGVMVFIQQLITAVVALGGALTAVAGSAVQAGAALGGALAAGLGQALPVIGLVIASLAKLKSVMDLNQQVGLVQQQLYQRQNDAQKRVADTSDTLANAADGVAAAEDRAAEAHSRVGEAQKALTKARRDAREEIEKLIQAERDAELAARGAVLSQAQARDRLREAVASGDVTGLADAELGMLTSDQGRRKAEADLARARRERRRAEAPGGLERMPGVVSAKKSLEDARKAAEDAEKGIGKAERALQKAHRTAAAATADDFSAMEKLQQMLMQASPGEIALFAQVQRFSAIFQSQFSEITDNIVFSFAHSLDRINDLLLDPRVFRGLDALSTQIGASMSTFTDEFTSPESLDQMMTLVDDATENLPALERIAESITHAFLNIAVAAGPALERIIGWVEDLTDDFEGLTDDRAGLETFFDRGADHLLAWADAAKEIVILLAALADVGEATGLDMIRDLTETVRGWTQDIRDNRSDVAGFFKDAQEATYMLLGLLKSLLIAMFDVFDPDKMAPLIQFLEDSVIPALVITANTFGAIVASVLKLIDVIPGGNQAFTALLVVLLAMKSIKGITGLLGLMGDSLSRLAIGSTGAALGLGKVFTKLSALAAKSTAFAGLAGVLGRLGGHFNRMAGGGRGGRGTSVVDTGLDMLDVADAADGTGGRRTTTAPRRRRGIFGRLFGGADDVAKEAADIGTKSGGFFKSGFARVAGGLLKGGLFTTLGVGAVAGIMSAFKSGDAKAGVRDFVSTVTFGIVDSAEEKAAEAMDNIEKTLKKRLDKPNQVDRDEFFRNTRRNPFATSKEPNWQIDPVTGDKFDANKITEKSEFDKWVDDLPAKLRKPVRQLAEMQDKLREFRRDRDLQGLEGLATDADKLGIKFPELADLVEDFSNKSVKAIEKVKLALKPDDIIHDFGKALILDPKHWRSQINNALDEIKKLPPGMQDQARRGMVQMAKGLEERGEIPKGMAKDIAERAGEQWKHYTEKQDKHTSRALKNLAKNMAAEAAVMDVATGGMVSTVNNILKSLGVGPVRMPRSGKEAGQIAGQLGSLVSGVFGGSRAGGGFVNRYGQRGVDERFYALGDGEAILNKPHQRYIAPAVEAFYGHPWSETFKRIRGRHAGADGEGLAVGREGAASMFDGHPGNVNAAVRRVLTILKRRFPGLVVTSTTDHSLRTTSGNISDHTLGAAVDLSGPVGLMNRAARYVLASGMARQLKQAIYAGNPMLTWSGGKNVGPGYFGPAVMGQHGNHLHLAAGKILAGLSNIIGRIRKQAFDWPHAGGTKDMGQALLDRVRKAGNRFIDQQSLSASDTEDPRRVRGGMTRGAVSRVITRAMELVGVPRQLRAGWRAMALDRAEQESAFNPNAVNNWDINARRGDPSRGLFQTIFSTFRAYAMRGHGNILNPLDNTLAAFRYMLSRYGGGNWQQALVAMLGRRGIGYATGGEIPGRDGQPIPVLAHAKEWIVNKVQQSKLARMAGTSVHGLRSMLGFSGSNATGFAGGGEVSDDERRMNALFTTAGQQRRLDRIRKGIYELPVIPVESWEELLREARRVFTSIGKAGKNYSRKINSLGKLTQDNGVLDEMDAARERFSSRLERGMTMIRISFDRVGGKLRNIRGSGVSESEIAAKAVDNARAELDKVTGEKGIIKEALDGVTKRLRKLRRGGVSKEEGAEVRRLETQRSNLRERMNGILDDQANALQTLLEARIEKVNQAVADINKRAEDATNFLDIIGRMASATGNTDLQAKVNAMRMKEMSTQADDLESQISKARALGNDDLVRELNQQVNDLRMSVFEMAQQAARDAMDAINTKTQKRLGRLDLFERMANAMGSVGLGGVASVAGETLTRAGVFQQRGAELESQRGSLQALLRNVMSDPVTAQNVGLIQDLTDQLAELDVTIAENTQAQFQARVEDVNRIANYGLGINDLNKRIAELTGQITGNTDSAKLLALAQERTQILETQRASLEQLLLDAMKAGDQAAINDLTTQLLENQVAVLENTVAINELNGTVNGMQTFSTTAWQMFQNAIFNGNSGLLPQYEMAITNGGAIAANAGMTTEAPVGDGSALAKSAVATPAGDTNIDVHYHEVNDAPSPMETAKRVDWEIKTNNTET
jgi:hypothetical protein